MPRFVFVCPNCHQLFEGVQDMDGRSGKCVGCGETFTIQLQELGIPQPSPKSSPQKPKPHLKGASQLIRDVGLEGPRTSPNRGTSPNTDASRKPGDGANTDTSPSTRTHRSGKSPSPQQVNATKPIASKPVSSKPAVSGSAVSKSAPRRHATAKPVAGGTAESLRRIKCGSCRGEMSVRAEHGGSKVACPHCRTKLTVPLFNGQPKQPAPLQAIPVTPSQNHPASRPTIAEPDIPEPNSPASEFRASDFPAMPNPQSSVRTIRQPKRHSTGSRTGDLFSDAWSLTFATAFPNCFMAIARSLLLGLSILPIMLVLAYSFALLTKEMDPASQEFMFTWITYLVVIALLGCVFSAVSGAFMMHGALRTVRGGSPQLFSGGEHIGGVLSLILLQMFGGLIYAAVIGACLYYFGLTAIGISIVGLIGLIAGIRSLLNLLAPMAVVDGLDPVAAMGKSYRIFTNSPMLLAFILTFMLVYLIIVFSTFGLALLFFAMPMQSIAAAYHLGNEATGSARA